MWAKKYDYIDDNYAVEEDAIIIIKVKFIAK